MEAELVYRAQNTAGRKDAAYVIQFTTTPEGIYFLVTSKWGSWERYHNATLQSKNEYTGTARSIAQSIFITAMGKREQRGYELQAHLSRFPNWLPAPLTAARQPIWQSPPEVRAVLLPEPEPEAGRIKHTRAGFIEL